MLRPRSPPRGWRSCPAPPSSSPPTSRAKSPGSPRSPRPPGSKPSNAHGGGPCHFVMGPFYPDATGVGFLSLRESNSIRMNASHSDSWTPELERLLSTWHRRMDACQHAYYLEAERYKRWHLWLGVPAVIFSTVVGTAVFATLESSVG